jgi:hypothetical protein
LVILVSASRKSFLCRMAFATTACLMLPALSAPAAAAHGQSSSPALDCRALIGTSDVAWTVELDQAIPLAMVDSEDTPAEYSSGHASIRLSPSGPNLFIGLHTGRLLVTAADGAMLGKGMCRPLMTAAASPISPDPPLQVTAALFKLSAA